jgi:hypothetical protein
MKISAATVQEVEFGHKALQRGQRFLASCANHGSFKESVIYPAPIKEGKAPKAPFICASCDSPIPTGEKKCCARCKVNYYCSRDCQKAHWKAGHKLMCRPDSAADDNLTRPSIIVDVATGTTPFGDGMIGVSVSYMTGRMSALGDVDPSMLKTERGQKVHHTPKSRNIYGDKEFIVKLQSPAGSLGYPTSPWMCDDGPVRSFQTYIPPDTSGLRAVYELLQRDGIESINPVVGLKAYKGYFTAKWEGGAVRIFYNCLAPPQRW